VPAASSRASSPRSSGGLDRHVHVDERTGDAGAHVAGLEPSSSTAWSPWAATAPSTSSSTDVRPAPLAGRPRASRDREPGGARRRDPPPRRRSPPYARAILEGTPWTVDLLETDRGLALANAGVGLDAEVVCAVAEARTAGSAGTCAGSARSRARSCGTCRPSSRWSWMAGPVRGRASTCRTRSLRGRFTSIRRAHGRRSPRGDGAAAANRRTTSSCSCAPSWGARPDHGVTMLRGTHVEVRSASRARVQLDGDPAGSHAAVGAHPPRGRSPRAPAEGVRAARPRRLADGHDGVDQVPTRVENSMFGRATARDRGPRGPG